MADPTWEQIDADSYRCTRCGVCFPAGRNCDCPDGNSPIASGVPHTTEAHLEQEIPSARAGELPSVDRIRKEQWNLYLETVAIARKSCKTTNDRDLRRAATAGKLYEIARKALDSAYVSAKDREVPIELGRYERLAAKLTGADQVSNRRAHAEEREN